MYTNISIYNQVNSIYTQLILINKFIYKKTPYIMVYRTHLTHRI